MFPSGSIARCSHAPTTNEDCSRTTSYPPQPKSQILVLSDFRQNVLDREA